MNFASDNAGPMHPSVLDAIVKANAGYEMPYGNDTIMPRVRDLIRTKFEAPEATVYLVATGTAANALALATYTNPWETIFAHRVAHVEEDECGSPEFYTNGAKLTLVEGAGAKMDPDALRQAIKGTGQKDVHSVQRGPVTITQATEVGTIYTLEEIARLTAIAKEYGLKTHLDGARFANACAALGCSAAEMTWKAGIDMVSFGGTKNGCAGVEAVIFFEPEKAWEFELRRKRGAHLFSKHRYLSAQMEAYLTGNLWLELGAKANANCARLVEGLETVAGAVIPDTPEANMVFAHLPRAAHRRAMDAGAQYYLFPSDAPLDGPDGELIRCRMVCDWSKSAAEIDQLTALLRG
ncbi:threonine aldolase family protein [Litoreibacter arenae]|uniref:Low-specificity L-threonine aldolase n=1 Tax=Litoreibacter arenae DSM 19593 TaxID=1123360 RepID=S9QGX4_9RHOB|nr:beta-eliminating lyase-related protein [Litoreibacter arenae]EPX80696.1 Low-specificity L-threonine aldolase [Litoreibacter arenae DSM 19593]